MEGKELAPKPGEERICDRSVGEMSVNDEKDRK